MQNSNIPFFQDPRFREYRIKMGIMLLACIAVFISVLLLLKTPSNAPETKTNDQLAIRNAQELFLAGKLKEAKEELLKINLNENQPAEAWELAGEIEEKTGRADAAIRLYSEAIKRSPSSAAYHHRGYLLRKAGKSEAALADLDTAIKTAPLNVILSNERLLLLIQLGRSEQASREITSVRKTTGNENASAWIVGICGLALEKEEFDEAKKALDAADALLPPEAFQHLLNDPVLIRHAINPEIRGFYFKNKPEGTREGTQNP